MSSLRRGWGVWNLVTPLAVFALSVAAIAQYELGATAVWPALVLPLISFGAGVARLRLPFGSTHLALRDAFTVWALLQFGPWTAILAALAGAAGNCLGERRQAKTQLPPPALDSVGAILYVMAATALAALIFARMRLSVPGETLAFWTALDAAAVTYTLFLTLGVAGLKCGTERLPIEEAVKCSLVEVGPSALALWIGVGLPVSAFIHGGWLSLHVLALLAITLGLQGLAARERERQQSQLEELSKLNTSIISSLATAIDAKDRYSRSHVNRVQSYALALAHAVDASVEECRALEVAALLRDVGKLGVPERILAKPGKLSYEEYLRVQSHVKIGAMILQPVQFPWPVLPVIESHHERWDGRGYPLGLKEDQIPLGGRILAIADVYDALTSQRPYRPAFTHADAIQEIVRDIGSAFDPQLVAVFERILPGLLQELTGKGVLAEDGAEALVGCETENASSVAHSQIAQATKEMVAVCDVADRLANSPKVEETVKIIAEHALRVLPGQTAITFLFSHEQATLEATAVEGKYAQSLGELTVKLGQGVTGWVAEHQRPLLNAPANLDLASQFASPTDCDLFNVLSVPLVARDETLGVISVYSLKGADYTEQHLRLLNIVADHAATALLNARRFERNHELALTDHLTGLANNRHMLQHLEALLHTAAQENAPFCVLMLDLNHFKSINDTLGHQQGDEVLQSVARLLADAARKDDLVARYAGDEFVLILADTTSEQAEHVVNRITQSVDALSPMTNGIRVSISVGLAAFPEHGRDTRTLIAVADQNMYRHKSATRTEAADRPAYRLPQAVAAGPESETDDLAA